jgi:hypothetical protein
VFPSVVSSPLPNPGEPWPLGQRAWVEEMRPRVSLVLLCFAVGSVLGMVFVLVLCIPGV